MSQINEADDIGSVNLSSTKLLHVGPDKVDAIIVQSIHLNLWNVLLMSRHLDVTNVFKKQLPYKLSTNKADVPTHP